MNADVVIAGGGPAGLAAAIRSGQRGLRTVLFERGDPPVDKACGEGLMPAGALELRRLGARIPDGAPFRGIRYLQEDGSAIEARFRGGEGVGLRRLELSAALRERARECGAEVRRGSVLEARAGREQIEVRTEGGVLSARLLVAADGLHSPLRRAAGLDGGHSAAPARYGIRRHFALAPWTDFVEVHWAPRLEAYVTPVGSDAVNVAFLSSGGGRFEDLLDRFPLLLRRLALATPLSQAGGAGPLLHRVRARHADRLALLGDAAGYVDAITGQGLSLAFAASALLFEALPADLGQDLEPALRRYDRELRSRFRRYALPAQALVWLSRHPRLRSSLLRSVSRVPGMFDTLLGLVA